MSGYSRGGGRRERENLKKKKKGERKEIERKKQREIGVFKKENGGRPTRRENL